MKRVIGVVVLVVFGIVWYVTAFQNAEIVMDVPVLERIGVD